MNHRKLLLPGIIAAILAAPALAQDPAPEADRKTDEGRQAAPRPATQTDAGTRKDRKPMAGAAKDRTTAARDGEEQPDEPEEEDR